MDSSVVQVPRQRNSREEVTPQIIDKAQAWQALEPSSDGPEPVLSKVRCRVEHVFGAIRNDRNARYMNCLGRSRSRVWIG